MRILIFSVLIATTLYSCTESARVLPRSWGDVDEVVLVEDTRFHNDSIYKLTDNVLRQRVGSFMQPQPMFSVLYRDIEGFDDHWSRHRNLIFVGVLDEENLYNESLGILLGEEGLARVRNGGYFRIERKEVWATGQTVHMLLGSDYQSLMEGLEEGLQGVVASIEVTEFEKIRRFVYSSGMDVDLTTALKEEHGIGMDIPSSYNLHSSSNGPLKVYRKSTIDLTATISVLEQPYTREVQVTPNYAIFVRDSLGKRFVRSQNEGAYMTTEKLIRPAIDTISVDGNFAIRQQGLWKMVGDFMGGAYVNYLIYDEKNQRVIYLDAYIHAPDIKSKRRLIREHEAIFNTFKLETAPVAQE